MANFELSEKQSLFLDQIFAAANDDCTEVAVTRLAEILDCEKNAAAAKYRGFVKTLKAGGQAVDIVPVLTGVGSRGRGKMTADEKAAHAIAKAAAFHAGLAARRSQILAARAEAAAVAEAAVAEAAAVPVKGKGKGKGK